MQNVLKAKPRPIFQPNWDKPPVFFLHIPKTAGSSNNEFLRSLYGVANFQAHAEVLLPRLTAHDMPALRVDGISGHIPLWAWDLYEGAENYARVTLLRDPWARVVSHINWVNLFNHGMPPPRHGPGAADLAVMIDALAMTDFEDRRSLQSLFDVARQLPYFNSFDNYQTRMLRVGAMDAMEKTLTAADVDAAQGALADFFHVGFCEDQAGFQDGLLKRLGLDDACPYPTRLNPARRRVLNVDNTLAADVFAPWYEKDQALVGFAKGITR